ncbi:hypothetical protein N7467_005739 [Penicillium canescens]|nr:hypothetical protein N7467_005739 [Penicillium canescens]
MASPLSTKTRPTTTAADAKFRGKGEPYTHEQWDSLLGDCAAASDLPCVAFAAELIEAYPDANSWWA